MCLSVDSKKIIYLSICLKLKEKRVSRSSSYISLIILGEPVRPNVGRETRAQASRFVGRKGLHFEEPRRLNT